MLKGYSHTNLPDLLEKCLWGAHCEGVILANDSSHVDSLLFQLENTAYSSKKITFLVGECGLELLFDLYFATLLVQHDYDVDIHVKSYPSFPLAATKVDIQKHIEMSLSTGLNFAEAFQTQIQESHIRIIEDEFYTSPLELAQANENLKRMYSDSILLIINRTN